MNGMTPRRRVRRALNHREPDRVPIDVGGTHDTTFLEESYRNVQKLLNTHGEGKPANRWLGSIYPDEETMAKLGSDFRSVSLPAPEYSVIINEDGSKSFTDEWGLKWTKKSGSYYFDVLEFYQVESVSDVEKLPWPRPDIAGENWRKCLEKLRTDAMNLRNTESALILDFGVAPMTMTQLFLGFEESCVSLIQRPKVIQAIMEKVLEIYYQQADGVFRAAGDLVEAVYAFADDLGTQNSLWLSPNTYRKVVKPYHKQVVDFIRRRTDAKIIFHSCGSIYDFIPDLIDVGIDALNPVQVSAASMEPLSLKSEFGQDLTFWGAIDTQHVLPHGTANEVREEVRKRIDILGRKGGYVLAPVHNIQPDVPAENIVAMVEEAREYRPFKSEV